MTRPRSIKPPSSQRGRPQSVAEEGGPRPAPRRSRRAGSARRKPSALGTALLWLRRLILIGLAVVLFFGMRWYLELPDARALETLGLGSGTQVYARDGTPIGSLSATLPDGTRLAYPLRSLEAAGKYLPLAVVTNEDRRFYEHHGIDPLGLARSLFKALTGDRLEGGSTLTQQVMKNTLLTELKNARSLERKVKEWMLSIQIERSYSKQEILSNYLNVAYWGDGGSINLIGARAASLAYFGIEPRELTLAQSVYLANLIPSPGRYFDFAGYRPLMRSLLERMVEDGRISPAQKNAALLEPIQPRGWRVRYGPLGQVLEATLVDRSGKHLSPPRQAAPHFMQQLERELVQRFGRDAVYKGGGLQVYSSLDPTAQRSADLASRNARIPAGATLGAVLLDPASGEVLAMVGQKLEGARPPAEYNNAAQGSRQIGSTAKALLFATALESGLPQTHRELDAPLSYPCASCPGGVYRPRNFDGRFIGGPVSMRYALVHSLNLPTLRVAERIGVNTFKAQLERLKLTPPPNPGLTLALGTLEASPLELSAAYAPFVNGGTYHAPTYLRKVTDKNGSTLLDSGLRGAGQRVWSEQTAYIANDMLRGVVYDLGANSLAARARIPGVTVGGKTGTTNEVRDLWFVGFTPELVGAVWVGKQQGGDMPDGAYSGEVSTPIWREMVAGALQNRPRKTYPKPQGIGSVWLGGRQVAVALQAPRTPRATPATPPAQPAPTQPASTPAPAQSTQPAAPPQELAPTDGTVLLELDVRTGYRATDQTPPEFRVERRVAPEELAAFEPPAPAVPSSNASPPDPTSPDPTSPDPTSPDPTSPDPASSTPGATPPDPAGAGTPDPAAPNTLEPTPLPDPAQTAPDTSNPASEPTVPDTLEPLPTPGAEGSEPPLPDPTLPGQTAPDDSSAPDDLPLP